MRCVISGPLNSSINGSQLRAGRLGRGSSFCCSCLAQKWILRFRFRCITFLLRELSKVSHATLAPLHSGMADGYCLYTSLLNINYVSIVSINTISPSVGMNSWQFVCIACFTRNILGTLLLYKDDWLSFKREDGTRTQVWFAAQESDTEPQHHSIDKAHFQLTLIEEEKMYLQ